jgi:hypothetical protein
MKRCWQSTWLLVALSVGVAAPAAASSVRGEVPSVSLAPAVLELKGKPGEGTKQTLAITNNSDVPLTFDLSVVDVVTRDGKRAFVPPGELAGSIAATAVLKPARVVAQPHANATAELTLTLPMQTPIRAIVARFQGQPRLMGGGPAISLGVGSLITFELSGSVSATARPLVVHPQTATKNLSISDWIENNGSEPFVVGGVIAILDSTQRLVTKLALPRTRFLPGERLELKAENPGELPRGRYRAVMSMSYASRILTQTADFDNQ